MADGAPTSAFQAGGTVQEGSVYIERAADRELYACLSQGEYCSVLAPRQIGKSSLRVRVARKLRAAGATTVELDLGIGTEGLTENKWYLGLAFDLAKRLRLKL